MGHHKQVLPTAHGFDYYFGIPYSNDMNPTVLMANETIIESKKTLDQNTVTKRYTEHALKYIEYNTDQPFFLYLAHNMPHTPLHVSPEFRGQSERGLYGDVIEEIDWSTGQILDKLSELGIDENTFVVFTSDNGPWLERGDHGGSADPLRGGKNNDVYEGGFRVPCVMRWPGKIPAGTVTNEMATTMDFLPTFAAWSNGSVPESVVLDGKNIDALATGGEEEKTPYENFLYMSPKGTLKGIRSGKWKALTVGETSNKLFDLENDIGETNNLKSEHNDLYKELRQKAKQLHAELEADEGIRLTDLDDPPNEYDPDYNPFPYMQPTGITPSAKRPGLRNFFFNQRHDALGKKLPR